MSVGEDDVAVGIPDDAAICISNDLAARVSVVMEDSFAVGKQQTAAQKLNKKLKEQRWKERRKSKKNIMSDDSIGRSDKVAAGNGEGGGGPLM